MEDSLNSFAQNKQNDKSKSLLFSRFDLLWRSNSGSILAITRCFALQYKSKIKMQFNFKKQHRDAKSYKIRKRLSIETSFKFGGAHSTILFRKRKFSMADTFHRTCAAMLKPTNKLI